MRKRAAFVMLSIVVGLIAIGAQAEMPDQFFFSFSLDIQADAFKRYIMDIYGHDMICSLEDMNPGAMHFRTDSFVSWGDEHIMMTYSFFDGKLVNAGALLKLTEAQTVHQWPPLDAAIEKFAAILPYFEDNCGSPTNGVILVNDSTSGTRTYDYPRKGNELDNEQMLHILKAGSDPYITAWIAYDSTEITIIRSDDPETGNQTGGIRILYRSPFTSFVPPSPLPFK